MTLTARFGPAVAITIPTVIDDGESLTAGPAIQGEVSLADLKGSAFYDNLVAQLPTLQAQLDAQTLPPWPAKPGRTPG